MEIDVCPICKDVIKDSEEICHLTQKGVSSLPQASKERQDNTLSCSIHQKIHKKCRQNYCHNCLIKESIEKIKDSEQAGPSCITPRRLKESIYVIADQIHGLKQLNPES